MAEDNKDKLLNDEADAQGDAPKTEMTGDDWTWDANVPEMASDDITLDAITEQAEKAPVNNTVEEEPKESKIKDDSTCIVCGKSLKNSTSELYCVACCEKFLKRNLGVGSIILAFVMVIVAAVGYFVCVSTCQISDHLTKTISLAAQSDYDGSITEYQNAVNTVDTLNSAVNAMFTGINENFNTVAWFDAGDAIKKTALEAYADVLTVNYSDRTSFMSAVDEAFDQKTLASPKYAKIKSCYDFCLEIEDVSATVADQWQTYIFGDGSDDYVIPYDETIQYLSSVKQETPGKKCVVTYYKFMTAYYADQSADIALDLIKQTYESAGDYGYMFLSNYMNAAWNFHEYKLLDELAQTALAHNPKDNIAGYYSIKSAVMQNKLNEANQLCENLKKSDPDGLTYYSIKAEVLRRLGKYDEAAKVCTEGLNVGTDNEILRQQAIVYMLQGDKTSAVNTAIECYQNALTAAYSGENVSLESFYTAAIIAKLCGDDTYQEINDLLTDEGIDYTDAAKKCLDGTASFEDTFMKGTGDII